MLTQRSTRIRILHSRSLCVAVALSCATFIAGCDEGSSGPRPQPPTRPTPPGGARPQPRPGPTPEEQKAITSVNTPELDAARKRHNTAVAFQLIKRRVHECGTDAHCLTTVDTALGRLEDEEIAALVPAITGPADAGVRAEVMRVVAMRNIRSAENAFLTALQDPRDSVAIAAATALGDMGVERAIPALVARLEAAPSEAASIAILRGLGRFNTRTAVDAIASARANASDLVLAVIVGALARTRHPASVAPLVEALRHNNPLVRLEAINGLSTLGDATAIKGLKGVAATDSDPRVRRRAQFALAEVRGEARADRVRPDRAPPAPPAPRQDPDDAAP